MRQLACLAGALWALNGVASAAQSSSVGSPNRGRLEGGVSPTNSDTMRLLPGYAARGVVWGHPDLVELLERASERVAKKFPDSVLGVGGLSRKAGGDVGGHASHESGRDADVAFYRKTSRGKNMGAMSFSRVYKTGITGDGTTFDTARNWALVEAMVSDPHAHVTHIFVVRHLRARLLDEGARGGASERVLSRAQEVLQQPRHAQPHDDHFHVRIGCPKDSRQCVEVAEAPRAVARARSRVAHQSSLKPSARAHTKPIMEHSTDSVGRTVPRREPPSKPSPQTFGEPLVKPLQRVQSNGSTSPLLDLIGPRVEGLDSAAINTPK